MTKRTNRHNSTNEEEWGSMDGGGTFGSWGSWVKYGGNVEGVGKYVGVWGEVRKDVVWENVEESVFGVWGDVWEVCWGVESVGKYGEV